MTAILLPDGSLAWDRAEYDAAWAALRNAKAAAASRDVIGALTVRGGLMATTSLYGGVLT